MDYQWDPAKRLSNLEKHGLDFEQASLVLNQTTIDFEDSRTDYGEKRMVRLGMLNDRLIVFVTVERRNSIRIISMRKANDREKTYYRKRLCQVGLNDG